MISAFEALESGAVGLTLSLVGTYLYSRRKGAESLDAEWQGRVRQEEQQTAAERETLRRLTAEIADRNRPKRTDSEERDYQVIKSIIEKCSDDEKDVLRHLKRHGKMIENHMSGFSTVPTGFTHDRAATVLSKLTAQDITTVETRQVPSGWERVWQIAPGAVSALDELL
jgi:hypothetical protein